MNAHIVLAHPEPTSFNGSMAKRALRHFHSTGKTCSFNDLYASGFDPVEGDRHYAARKNSEAFAPLDEQRQAWKNGTTPDDVKAEINNLLDADLVMTCHGIFPPFGIRVRPNEGTDHEANEIYRRADHRHFD